MPSSVQTAAAQGISVCVPVDEYSALQRKISRLTAELAAARAQILALESQHRWRSVESAPKDGSEILGFRADAGVLLVKWDAPINFCTDYELRNLDEASAEQYDWFCADFMTSSRLEGDEAPTHWMPLPALPPAETEPTT